jgi:hypothetical protein
MGHALDAPIPVDATGTGIREPARLSSASAPRAQGRTTAGSAIGTADSRQGSTGSSRCQDVLAPVIFAGVG